MVVDSYRYLPRSFVPFYENRGIDPVEPVWTPLSVPLAQARVALLSSAGIYLPDTQDSFDLDRERNEPTWGDPSWRLIPRSVGLQPRVETAFYEIAHLHLNPDPIRADLEVALPIRTVSEWADQGLVGSVADQHYSVMGYQSPGLEVWLQQTGPEIAAHAHAAEVSLLILAPA